MAAKKQIALGSIFKLDFADAATFEVLSLVMSAEPPARQREEIEGKALGDTLDVPLLGIEQSSRMTLTQFWHPGDTDHQKLDTLFGSRAIRPFQIVTPHATPVTDEFDVQVVALAPQSLEVNGTYRRQVTLLRCSDITRT